MKRMLTRGPAVSATRLVAALALVVAPACDLDETLQVDDPDVVKPTTLTSAAALPALLNGTRSEFQVAYIGDGGDNQITISGLLADELYDIETFPTRIEVDQRNAQEVNATLLPVYRNLHRARAAAATTAQKYAELAPSDPSRAEVLALEGFANVMFAENYCEGVPLSRLDASGELLFGAPQTRALLLDTAIAKFDAAMTQATAAGAAGTTFLHLARVGRARALLDRASTMAELTTNAAAAATLVSAVPTTFQYLIFASENSGRQNNGVYLLAGPVGRRYAGGRFEGGNGLNFIDADPRARSVRPTPTAVGFDNVSPAFYQQKYPARNSSAVLADGIEARLIEAEAAMLAGNTTAMLTALNAARAPYASIGVAPLTAADIPASATDRQNLLFRERAYSLWLTSHRLGDLRRLVRQYGRAANSVFPTGAYPRPVQANAYLNDVNLPIPFEERYNPNVGTTAASTCLNRSA